MSGILLLVGTPIGNLGDVSDRTRETLAEADLILCEDTRRTRGLLSALAIPAQGRLIALHAHNEGSRIDDVLGLLAEGATVALVSDAGMPGISDPGERLVAAAVAAGLAISVVPGPSAVLSALVVSGFQTDRFCMEGFLARKGKERAASLGALVDETRTAIIFESPHRLSGTLGDLSAALGAQRRVVVAREMTKLHEEIWRGTLGDAVEHWEEREVRGEIVIVLDGAQRRERSTWSDEELVSFLTAALVSGASRRDASQEAADVFGVPRRRAYELATKIAPPS